MRLKNVHLMSTGSLIKIKTQACSEVFAVGTAAVVTPLSSLGEIDGTSYKIKKTSVLLLNL